MKFLRLKNICLTLMVTLIISSLSAAMAPGEIAASKDHDLSKYHNVGNIWLRVSNYGFFGSGDDIQPPWPSLEYPGGSGVDYLYQGALWFGAKKYRKSADGQKLYWRHNPPRRDDDFSTAFDMCTDPTCTTPHLPEGRVVVDTLVTVGFDGDADLYEFLPAYNALEYNVPGYDIYNRRDVVMTTSTRDQRRGVDDDGDGMIDEDPIGFAFPFRKADELPAAFSIFAEKTVADVLRNPITHDEGLRVISDNLPIWYPLGFQDLSYPMRELHTALFNYADVDAFENDSDADGLRGEDGFPVSEQDYISYYYDYSPFNSPGQRDFGSARSRNDHIPLRLFVRQMSYQWSYEYIKNLVYVEFNITNMNPVDTLFDCAMGIYMDCDVGPQSLDGTTRAKDDKSGYVRGTGYEFAFSFDADFDGGVSPGYVGARVCTPDPEQLEFSCWFWKVGDGPNDFEPRRFGFPSGRPFGRNTANEKYWLLTGRNPAPNSPTKYQLLRKSEDEQIDPLYIQEGEPTDTRFLFAFYGDNKGFENPDNPDSTSWNLAPGKTMKIVVAVFPGDTIEDLKQTATWAKTIYGQAQTLTTAILPDTFRHYIAPEPPDHPFMYSELVERTPNHISLDVYWGNRSEFCMDEITVEEAMIGWFPGSMRDSDPFLFNETDHFTNPINQSGLLPNGKPWRWNGTEYDGNAILNPLTAWRIRHDFQGYRLWGRSGRGDDDATRHERSWDKLDTLTDREDYVSKFAGGNEYIDFGGELGRDVGLPQRAQILNPTANSGRYIAQYNDPDYPDLPNVDLTGYYMQDKNYFLRTVEELYNDNDEALWHNGVATVFGIPLYNLRTIQEIRDGDPSNGYPPAIIGEKLTDAEIEHNQLLFMHESLRALGDKGKRIYLALVEDNLIPLRGHQGQAQADSTGFSEKIENRQRRLSRRYYQSEIRNLPKGKEYYVSVTAFDRGLPRKGLGQLDSGKDANMMIHFPGPLAKSDMKNIFVVPNPYRGSSTFDGHIDGDTKGDKGRRLWFVNLPERCNVQIFTLAGDLVHEFEHYGNDNVHDIITISKAAAQGYAASGIHSWDLLSRYNQIVASGLYFFSVKDRRSGDVKVGKFAVIR